MKFYTKIIDGEQEIKPRHKIIVEKDDKQYINPTHEMLIEDGWEEYVIPEPTTEELLEREKAKRRREILEYDSSEEVNLFYLNDKPIWLDKATRVGLMLRFQAEQATGKSDTTLWYESYQFELPIALAMQMLYAIELYASQCYDNTQRHIAEINKMITIEGVDAYDYTQGYPEKLTFNTISE